MKRVIPAALVLFVTACETSPPTDVPRPNEVGPGAASVYQGDTPVVVPGVGTAPAMAGTVGTCTGDVLLIQDNVPWSAPAGEDPRGANATELTAQGRTFCVIPASAIGTTTLSGFQMIIIAGAQTQSFYDALFPGGTVHSAISAYVSGGGVLSASLADNASGPGAGGNWNGDTFVGGLTKASEFVDDNSIAAAGHPVIADTLPCPGGHCAKVVDIAARNDLDSWGFSSHGYFTNLPAGTTVILQDNNVRPVFIDYAHGSGRVIASMTTLEWRYVGGLSGELPRNRKLLANDIAYQASRGGATTTERVPANQPATVTVKEGGKAVAGIDIKAFTFQEDVNVTVRFRKVQPGDPCHGTLFGQTGRCLEVTAEQADGGGKAILLKPVIIAACPPENKKTGLDFFKFESQTGRAVALKEVDEFFTDCSGFTASAAESSWLKRFAMGLVNRAGRLFGPEPLRAALFNFGVGHGTPDDDPFLSHFTWASEIQVSTASLAVNVKNSGKDAFGVAGVFGLEAPLSSAFPPPQVTVSFGDGGAALPTLGADDVVQTLSTTVCPTSTSRGCWRLSFGHWVWSAPFGTTTGILVMSIKADASGTFAVGGAVPNTGLVRGTPTFRAFSLQIGTRTQGVGLECAADGKCTVHAD